MDFVCKIHLNICLLVTEEKFAQQRLVRNKFKEQTLKACNKSNYVIFLERCIFFWQIPALSILILFFYFPFFILYHSFSFSASIKMKIQKINLKINWLSYWDLILHCPRWLNTGNVFPGVKKTKSDYAKIKTSHVEKFPYDTVLWVNISTGD